MIAICGGAVFEKGLFGPINTMTGCRKSNPQNNTHKLFSDW